MDIIEGCRSTNPNDIFFKKCKDCEFIYGSNECRWFKIIYDARDWS